MIRRTTRIQLVVFTLVSVLSIWYGAVRFLDVGAVFSGPYLVEAQFARPGGIYPRADVDLLGTRVGRVAEVNAGPGSATTVVLAIDKDVRIPRDVTALIGNKSAIGEQYVELEPQSPGGAVLADGDVIPLSATTSPLEVSQLLSHLDGLASSIPREDLTTVMTELSTALSGLGPPMGRLLDDSDRLTQASLENVEELTGLIDDARTVLDTQVELGPQTTTYLRELASLTSRLRQLDADFDEVFVHGIRAGTEFTNLLRDNQAALPVLLANLVAVTDIGADRVPAIRKTLVMFPWIVELGATVIRPCDEYDPRTGLPIERTCHYDEQGRPIYTGYLAGQLAEQPGKPPYLPCVSGYEGTDRHHPDGTAIDGGPPSSRDPRPNWDARCSAPPTDPTRPNVRGSQNAHDYGSSGSGRAVPGWGLALYNPNNGTVASPDGLTYRLTGSTGRPPPKGDEALGWLLTSPMTNEEEPR